MEATKVWYLAAGKKKVGPISTDRVRERVAAGKVPAGALAWKEGMNDWLPVDEIHELALEAERKASGRQRRSGSDARLRSGSGERAKAGLLFNELVRKGEVKAPIVIGRDHLDAGSVASPYRETEGMQDGSDAIADWPLLNALVNTAAGASWVSIHHGGGVGIGYSLHAGMVVVADGTEDARTRLERVLTTDPGMGVIRHVDAGYDEARAAAREHGIRIPMEERG